MDAIPEIPAVSVAVLRGDSVLLVRRGRPPGQGLFAFPGGRVEPGETLEEAARRELLEETGLAVGAMRPVRDYLIDAERDGAALRYRLLVFAAEFWGGEPVAGDDADAVGWFNLDAMAALPLSDRVMEVARELLGGTG